MTFASVRRNCWTPWREKNTLDHLVELTIDLYHSSPEGSTKYFWVWFPLGTDVEISSANVANTATLHQRLLAIQTDEASNYTLQTQTESLIAFWIKARNEKPILRNETVKTALPFATNCFYAASLPTFAIERSRLQPERDCRRSLSNTRSRFEKVSNPV